MAGKIGVLLAIAIAVASALSFSAFRAGSYPASDPVLRAGAFAFRVR